MLPKDYLGGGFSTPLHPSSMLRPVSPSPIVYNPLASGQEFYNSHRSVATKTISSIPVKKLFDTNLWRRPSPNFWNLEAKISLKKLCFSELANQKHLSCG